MPLKTIKVDDKLVVLNKYKYNQLVNSIIKSQQSTDQEKIDQLIVVINSILNDFI